MSLFVGAVVGSKMITGRYKMGKQKNIIIGGLAVMALAFAIGMAVPSTGVWAAEDGDENIGAGGPVESEGTEEDGEKTDEGTGDEKDDDEEGKKDETGEDGEEIAEESDYGRAVAAIANYNKLQALQAAVTQVQEKVPVAVALWDMVFGAGEIKGETCEIDHREFPSSGCDTSMRIVLIGELARADGVWPEQDESMDYQNYTDAIATAIAPYREKTFEQLIEMAKSDEKYEDLREIVEKCEEIYERGVAALRRGLAVVDPELEDLDGKTGDELLEIYNKLDRTMYPEEELGTFKIAYQNAYVMLRLTENGVYEFPEDDFVWAYGDLVAATKRLDPEFEVDLTGVALLEPEQEGSDVPTAPNTGKEGWEEVSVVVVKVAVFGLAVIVAGIGGVVIAKRFMFSPLKRKR